MTIKDRARREAGWMAAAIATTTTAAVTESAYGGWWWTVAGAGAYAATHLPRVRTTLRWRPPRTRLGMKASVAPLRIAEALSGNLKARIAARKVASGWGEISAQMGWDKTGKKDGDENPAMEVRATLVHARAVGNAVEVKWRPLLAAKEKEWEGQGHAIRRWLGAPTCRVWIDHEDTGIAIARIGLRKLPKELALKAAPKPITLGRNMAIWLGPMGGGGDAYWRPYDVPHQLICGRTRFGKGATARLELTQIVTSGAHVVVLNTKEAGEFGWLRDIQNVEIIDKRPEMIIAMKDLEDHRRNVQELLRVHDADDWTYLKPELRPLPVFLVIDEFSEIADDPSLAPVADLMATFARMSASAGIYMIVLAQRPDVTKGAFGKRGGQARDQLGCRVAVGSLGRTGLGMMFGEGDSDVSHGLPGIKGRALVAGLDADGGSDTSWVQVAWLPQDVAARATGARLAAGLAGSVSGSVSEAPSPPQGGTGRFGSGNGNGTGRERGSGGTATDARAATDGVAATGLGPDVSDPPSASGAETPTNGPVEPLDDCDTSESPGPDNGPRLMRTGEAAGLFGVTPKTVSNWANDDSDRRVEKSGKWGWVIVDESQPAPVRTLRVVPEKWPRPGANHPQPRTIETPRR